MNRRDFIRDAAAGAAMLKCFSADLSALQRETGAGKLERRSLGRTGEKLSIIGFGGIVVMNATTEQAAERVAQAIGRGVNYFDVAPSYGNAEDMLGPALKPYRKDVFLNCKTQERTRDGANTELERSLQKLQTDHFDVYQLHAVTKLSDVKQILGPGGALEAFAAAKKAGKIRFLGFSAHSVEAALALMDGFDFDTILFPINFATWNAGNFGPQVLEKAKSKQMGILALKAMAKTRIPRGQKKEFEKCWYEPLADREQALAGLRFTLSHPVTAAIPPGDENLFRMALDLAAQFTPLKPEEAEALKRQAQATEPLFKYPSSEA
ncbi:MAG: aldo/keto reductase [Acidobacteria bacterium]|nr:MAG: aldo/keto reductase [Acidobacteriota bacterium]